MTDFGWSYPPGCDGPPDDYHPDEDMLTVAEFCDHIGITPLATALRAIEKHNTEAVDIMIANTDGEWLGPDDWKRLTTVSDDDPIEKMRVRGIAWDGSDWEWSEETQTLDGLDQLRQDFNDALQEHLIEEEHDDE